MVDAIEPEPADAKPKRKRPNRDGSKPRHKPTPATRGLVLLAATLGASRDTISAAMKIKSHRTLERWYATELARAELSVRAAIARTYIAKCLGGDEINGETPDWRKADTNALIHFMRTRLTERTEVDVEIVGATPRLGRDFKTI